MPKALGSIPSNARIKEGNKGGCICSVFFYVMITGVRAHEETEENFRKAGSSSSQVLEQEAQDAVQAHGGCTRMIGRQKGQEPRPHLYQDMWGKAGQGWGQLGLASLNNSSGL